MGLSHPLVPFIHQPGQQLLLNPLRPPPSALRPALQMLSKDVAFAKVAPGKYALAALPGVVPLPPAPPSQVGAASCMLPCPGAHHQSSAPPVRCTT